MNKIDLRGVIVSSFYDDEYFAGYIARGIICPESYFRRELAKADKGQPLQVHINSPGGSVFATYEMLNALRAWREETKQPASVTIGALAASCGAIFAVLSGVPVKAYKNAKIMFHSATCFVDGGPGAMTDTADLLGKINAEVKTALVGRYALAPDAVEAWFAEGRMGWLDAAEAKACGLVSEIVDSEDAAIDFAEADVAALGEKGLAVAAVLGQLKPAPAATFSAAELIARESSIRSAMTAEFAPTLAALEQAKAKIGSLEAELKASQKAAVQSKADAAEVAARLERLTGRRVAAGDSEMASGGSWAAAVAKYGYIEARNKFPELYAEHRANCKRMRGEA